MTTLTANLNDLYIAHAELRDAGVSHLSPLWDWLGERDEGEWHAVLDAHPEAHDVRVRFAAWLRERGDERADGYAALAACERVPRFLDERIQTLYCFANLDTVDARSQYSADVNAFCRVPGDWYIAMMPPVFFPQEAPLSWRDYPTRRAAEDAAALAFRKLPARRRAKLLRGVL